MRPPSDGGLKINILIFLPSPKKNVLFFDKKNNSSRTCFLWFSGMEELPRNLSKLFSTYIFNFTSYIFFFVVKLFHVCGLAEINMQTFQIGEPISLKQCELWQKVLSSSVHSFWLKKENYKWKPRGLVKLRTRERDDVLYFNEKEKKDVLNPWSMIF